MPRPLRPLTFLLIALVAALSLGGAHFKRAEADPAYGYVKFDLANSLFWSAIYIDGYQFTKSIVYSPCASAACQLGSYTVALSFDPARFTVNADAGTSSGGNGPATLNDASKAWRSNEWAYSQVRITSGTGAWQSRFIQSNTKTQIIVAAPWDVGGEPDATSVYEVGGLADGGYFSDPSACGAATYGTGTASLTCSGTPSGSNRLAIFAFRAVGTGLTTISLAGTQLFDAATDPVPADIINRTLRGTFCPDSAPSPIPDGVVNSGDLLRIVQAFGQRVGDPLYTPQKDPDMNGVIASGDQFLAVSVFGKRCVQATQNP